jgi:hypothetical protein
MFDDLIGDLAHLSLLCWYRGIVVGPVFWANRAWPHDRLSVNVQGIRTHIYVSQGRRGVFEELAERITTGIPAAVAAAISK